jgi:DNA repair exonuclease SbcCD ATPase subunit
MELTGPAQSPALAPQPSLPVKDVAVPDVATDDYWKERALAAERRVEKTNHVMRAALIPHLARWLMSKLVRGLAMQRKQLMETQQKAEQELAELEQRLVAVQAPLEDRLKAYEQRIAELEKGLTAKGEENRELIKATIAIAKKKLEQERSKDRLAWN